MVLRCRSLYEILWNAITTIHGRLRSCRSLYEIHGSMAWGFGRSISGLPFSLWDSDRGFCNQGSGFQLPFSLWDSDMEEALNYRFEYPAFKLPFSLWDSRGIPRVGLELANGIAVLSMRFYGVVLRPEGSHPIYKLPFSLWDSEDIWVPNIRNNQ